MPIEVTIRRPEGHVVASRTYQTEDTVAAHAHAREWYQTDPCFEGIDPVEMDDVKGDTAALVGES